MDSTERDLKPLESKNGTDLRNKTISNGSEDYRTLTASDWRCQPSTVVQLAA